MNTSSFLVAIALLSVAVPADSWAQSRAIPPDARVAYVSSQRLSTDSAAGKAGAARVLKLQQERVAALRVQQQALESTRRLLASATSADERAKLSAQEAAQRVEVERNSAQAQQDLQNLQREISIDLRPKVVAALNELLKGTKIELVLNYESSVVWSAPGLDLTDAVVEKMNAASQP
jgi:Skp family chaperone for outer membrane proteins